MFWKVLVQHLKRIPKYSEVAKIGLESLRDSLVCPKEARCYFLQHKEMNSANNLREIKKGSFPSQASDHNAA